MQRTYPQIPFERYADDALCHCRTREEAEDLKAALERRFAECRLELHPEKTKIVYCKDDDRRLEYPCTRFDFLGYTFCPRRSKNRWGKYFINFSPAISNKAAKAIRQGSEAGGCNCAATRTLTIWHGCSMRSSAVGSTTSAPSTSRRSTRPYNTLIANWPDGDTQVQTPAPPSTAGRHWLRRIARRQPGLFAHWRLLYGQAG